MKEFSGYRITQRIYDSAAFALYRGVREQSGELVLLKVPAERHPSKAVIEKIEREYEAAHGLEPSRIIRPLQIEHHDGPPMLVLEDDGSQRPVSELLGNPIAAEQFLKIAIGAAEALGEVHQHDLIHKDIRPRNLFFNLETGQVRITGFGIASLLPLESGDGLHTLEGAPAYMSPEQTGRINRIMDCRTDFYSLGISFYQMLTGVLPFEASDLLEWIYCHIARAAAPPFNLLPDLPKALSDIVMRLLNKSAEDRYQSAGGLQFDLERCSQELRATGGVKQFSLGQRDLSGRLQVPGRLYGRQSELGRLAEAFARVASTGTPELALVSGGGGVGKSALVGELQDSLVASRAFFASAKFDQFNRDTAYETMAAGASSLVRQILVQNKERLKDWKAALQAAAGLNGRLLIDLIPDLQWILGPQPPVVELPIHQAQSRLHLVFAKFLRLFASAQRPLLFFLDDLQWSDSSSLELLSSLLSDPSMRYLLVLGSYRESEVSEVHPLRTSIERIRCAGVPVDEMCLKPLSLEELSRLMADTLHRGADCVVGLAQLVHAKTGGNPFFVIQFLDTLVREGLITFNNRTAAWEWDMAGISAQSHTDNVVDLMVEKLARMSPGTRQTIHLASCLGHQESISLLAALAGKTKEQIGLDLREPFWHGLILKCGDDYRFLHDQVRQSAYALAPEERRQKTHLSIGRLMRAQRPHEQLQTNLFKIVHHFNLGAALLESELERSELAELNLAAGIRARESCAYISSAQWLRAGIALLGEDAWRSRHELAYRLHFEQAQCSYLCSDFNAALLQFRALRMHAKSALARAEIVRGEVDAHTMAWELGEAVDCGIEGLRRLGVQIDAHPGFEQVKVEYGLIGEAIGNRPIEQLADLPPMSDNQIEAAMLILAALQPASFFTDRKLYLFCCCRMVHLSVAHGNSPVSPIAYGALGAALGPGFGKYREGFEFGLLSSKLVETRGLLAHKAEIHFIRGGLIEPWVRPLSSCLGLLEDGFRVAGEIGDLIFGCYCGIQIVLQKLLRGDSLESVELESEKYLEFTRKARAVASIQMLAGVRHFIEAARGLTAGMPSLEGDGFNGQPVESGMAAPGTSVVQCSYQILKLYAFFITGEFEQALRAGAMARPLLWSVLGTAPEFLFYYFEALALAATCRKGGPKATPELLETLALHQTKLGEWAANNKETFFHADALVSAEIARIKGEDSEAGHLYDEAIKAARENGFLPNEAIAYELAGRFYLERRFEASARAYLREARGCYARWEAEGKVRELQEYDLLERGVDAGGTMAAAQEGLDLMTVVKASQAISGEITLPALLETLLEIVQENAGAQKAALLLPCDGDFKIAATAEKEGVELAAEAAAGVCAVPETIVHYVIRTHEKVLLEDAASDALFSKDEYIVREKPKSVLCLPILKQTDLVGLLYLENKLAPGAFTSGRLAVLELLASQAAISLQNAIFYGELQRENQVRKQAEKEVRTLNMELEERVERRTEQLRRSLDKEELLRKEVHHRVKNNLQVISSLLYLQSLDSRDPGTQEVLRESQSRTRSIALIHEKLYQSSDLARIDFAVYTRQLAANLFDSYRCKPGFIKLKINAEGVFLGPDVAVPCGLILNELVSNSLKYAFAEDAKGEIEIDFRKLSDGGFQLRVRDTGRGLPEGFDLQTATTLGVRLVRDLTLQLNGTVEFKSENGVVVNITIPDSAA